MQKQYKQLLKDPRWIRKRKEIIKRDNNACTNCGSKEKLNVHHIYYSGGYAPWEYEDDCLVTLCEICHKKWHETHEIEFRSHPKGSPKKKTSYNFNNKKNKRKKNKPSRLVRHALKKPKLCWAIIQSNREDYIRLKDGTWVHKSHNSHK